MLNKKEQKDLTISMPTATILSSYIAFKEFVMKRRSWILLSLVTTFIAMAATIALWIAHTRLITNGITSLEDQIRSYSMVLRHGDITFSKQSIMDIKADIKDVTLTIGEGNISQVYHVDQIKISSNLWARELILEFPSDITLASKAKEAVSESLYKFTHNPIIKVVFKRPSSKNWNSIQMLQQVKLESVGYQHMKQLAGKMMPVTQLESLNIALENIATEGALDWNLQFNLLNHEYMIEDPSVMDQMTRDFYKLVAFKGKSSMQLAMNISDRDGMKLLDDGNKAIDFQISNLKFTSPIYNIQIKGEVEKLDSTPMPYFNITMDIDNLERMLSQYAEALNISIERLKKQMPESKFTTIKESDVLVAARILRESSHNPAAAGEASIKIVRDNLDFKIADVSLPLLVQQIQDACKAEDEAAAKAKKSVKGKKASSKS